MALNVQTVGDEAIYIPWPGYTGTPIPTSGKTIPGLTGRKELRTIKNKAGQIIWAHKWHLNLSGENCTFSITSNDVKATSTATMGRCKNGKTLTVTVTPNEGYEFEQWSDGNTNNPRTFTMTSHLNYSVTCVSNITVRFFAYESASTPFATAKISRGSTAESVTPAASASGIVGWTFDGWHCKGAGNSKITDALTEDTDFYAYWYKEFNNLIIRTSDLPGNNSTSGTPDEEALTPNNYSYVWLNHLAYASELSLPAGATVSIAYLMSLLNHDGNVTSHYLNIAPCIISSGFQYDPRTAIAIEYGDETYSYSTVPTRKISETWRNIYKGSRTWDANKQKWVYTNSLDEGVTLKIDTSESPTLKNDWGKYAPLQWYNNGHWYDDSALIDGTTGAAIPIADWALLTPKFVGRWSRPTDTNPNAYDPKKHSHLSSSINTNRSVDNGLIQVDFDDYCVEGRTTYPIPATMEDGLPANELTLLMSKQSVACTVQWRLLIHQLKFDLR